MLSNKLYLWYKKKVKFMSQVKFVLTVFLILRTFGLFGQTYVEIQNPSFECDKKDRLRFNRVTLENWVDCSHTKFPGESGFYVQPGFFDVDKKAKHGETYIGLVTRGNGTYQSICQKLDEGLKKDSSYNINLYLAKSDKYESKLINGLNDKIYSYTKPIILRVWGGNSHCDLDELLFQTDPIIHSDWKEYTLVIKSKKENTYITFEAFYPNKDEQIRGNILLDAINFDQMDKYDSVQISKFAAYEIVDIIKEIDNDCINYAALLKIVKDINLLKINEFKLSNYLDTINEEKFASLIESLKMVKAVTIQNIFERIYRIKYVQNKITEEDEKFLQDYSLKYQETREETLDIYMTRFVGDNKAEIIKQLVKCK